MEPLCLDLLPGRREDIECPDCGAQMVLREGRYGLFYGCSAWSETRCPGSHKALFNGAPCGVPANQETRRARKELCTLLEQAMKRGTPFPWSGVGEMSLDECQDKIRKVRYTLGGYSRYDRIVEGVAS